jgi:alpha-tubulin suppressor-like RCC1 family protein
MRTAFIRFGLAALAALALAACSDQREIFAPSRPDKAIVAPKPCITITCTQSNPTYVDVSAGDGVTCAIHFLDPRILYYYTVSNLNCWGDNTYGMLGTGQGTTSEVCNNNFALYPRNEPCSTSPLMTAGGVMFSAVSVGRTHVCGIQSGTGAVTCWGDNRAGQIGNGTSGTSVVFTPGQFVPGLAFSQIQAGDAQTCGVTTSQALFCWGQGFGPSPVQVDPANTYRFVATRYVGLDPCGFQTSGMTCGGWHTVDVLATSGTADHMCQIFGGGRTECWGEDKWGQLGNGTASNVYVKPSAPTEIFGFTFQSISAGDWNTCALSGTNAFCWGNGRWGQNGTGTQNSAAAPAQVIPPWGTTIAFSKISVGAQHVCGLAGGGAIWCWGRNESGQLGLGTTNTVLTYVNGSPIIASATPVRVVGS